MRQVRIQKRSRWMATLGAVMAASALLSAFQPASAQVLETAWAAARVQQGDFDISFSVQEHSGGRVCANITNVVTGEYHVGACGSGFDVEVSDTLNSAWGAGTGGWTVYSANKDGGSEPGSSTRSGTITIDMTWVGSGDLNTNLNPQGDPLNPLCWISWEGGRSCMPRVNPDQTRAAAASGTVTDSEWGTFVIEAAVGSMWQRLI